MPEWGRYSFNRAAGSRAFKIALRVNSCPIEAEVDEFPQATLTGHTHESGDFHLCLERAPRSGEGRVGSVGRYEVLFAEIVMRYDYVKTRREDVKPYPRHYQDLIRAFIRTFTRINVRVYRLSKGRVLNKFPGGYDICIVTTRGARSGKRRDVALIHLPHGKDKLLVASQGGTDTSPSWYYNVKAYPEVTIMFGAEEQRYRARQVDDAEKRTLWPHLISIYPDFDQYQARTDRNIPVFRCEPIDTARA